MSEPKIKWYGQQVFDKATQVNIDAMDVAGALLEKYVKQHFTKQGAGRAVRRTKSGKYHRASLAGQPPAIDTGSLRASIMHTVEKKGSGIVGKVGAATHSQTGSDLKYALFMELGTRTIQARPYLRPALAATGRQIKRIFDRANGK